MNNEPTPARFSAGAWRIFLPTIWDWALLAGSLGAFTFLFMLFVRVLPALPAHELGKTWVEENGA